LYVVEKLALSLSVTLRLVAALRVVVLSGLCRVRVGP